MLIVGGVFEDLLALVALSDYVIEGTAYSMRSLRAMV